MKNLKNIKNIPGRIKEIAVKNKILSTLTMALMIFMTQITPVFAAINGNNIKTNLVDNFIKPIYTVFFVGLLVKEFVKKNTVGTIMIVIIGGLIGIFVFFPDSINSVVGTIKSVLGI